MVAPTTAPGIRSGALRRAWVRLFGESDAIERQLSATAKEGATLARVAHVCALFMLILFSAGSLVALAGDSIQAIAAGHATFPAIIAAGVSGLLVACMDCSMLYAASVLRLLASRHADKAEGTLHRWVLGSVAILEAATYGYMSWRYEAPADGIAWALIAARALAAPLLSVYLSLARPLPVMARDMLALAERISGEGVLRDLARIAGDTSASLADKVSLYIASAVISPDDNARLSALLDVARQRIESAQQGEALSAASQDVLDASGVPSETPEDAPEESPADDSTRPPTGPGSPARKPRQRERVKTPDTEAGSNVVAMPRRRKPRKSAPKRVARGSVEPLARAHFASGMSAGDLMRASGISKGAASKWRHILQAEADQADQAAQADQQGTSDQAAQ